MPKEPGGEDYRRTVRLERAGRDVNDESFGMAQATLLKFFRKLFDMPVRKKRCLRIELIEAALNEKVELVARN